MPREYRLKRRVHFYETDAAGIVHFSCFFRYMEEAEHEFWREAGISVGSPTSEIGWPRVSASVDYHAPLRYQDEFEICIRVAEIKDRSIRYTCLMTRGAEKIATGRMTIVCVSRPPRGPSPPMKSVSIPADIVARFQAVDDAEPFS